MATFLSRTVEDIIGREGLWGSWIEKLECEWSNFISLWMRIIYQGLESNLNKKGNEYEFIYLVYINRLLFVYTTLLIISPYYNVDY